MDFNTKQVKEGIEQIAGIISGLVTECVQEGKPAGIGEIELEMRQLLQEVGRQAIGQVLEKQDSIGH